MSIKTNPKKCIIIVLAFLISTGSNAHADFTFGEPTNLGPTINSPHSDYTGSFSSDGLEMYFDSNRSGGSWDSYDIYVSRRATTDDAWGTLVKLGPPVNSSSLDFNPIISTDGLSLYFSSFRAGGYGSLDIWVATRASVSDPWGEPSNLGPTINTHQDDDGASISCDGLVLYFRRKPPPSGPGDIYMSTRPTTNDAWGEAVNLGPTVNSSSSDGYPRISANGLSMFFESNRPGGFGNYDLYVMTRPTIDDDWGIPVNLGPAINTSVADNAATFLPDGSTLYFSSERPGGAGGGDIWQAPIIPIVDFNGDGIVDSADMCIMVDHWGEYYPLCDVGPTPLGDGIVDVQDLSVLAEHLFEEVDDPTLIAHWPLDEAQGSIAYNNAADCDGTLIGDPVWQPDGGVVAGALQFDGTDDHVSTNPVLDPAYSTFSVIAWIKGGAPSQVVISQQDGANWLMTDAEGKLMTDLQGVGRDSRPLQSQAVITDGQWHRIGLLWDGLQRTLYVDGVVVVEDTQSSMEASGGGLYMGAGKDLAPGSFFSGLIDDVRVYNRPVCP